MNTRTALQGFTLIELVVVITILGILAAFAVPRFASMEGQARLAATQSLAGSLRSGAALSHAVWLANGNPAANSVTMEGVAVAMNFGYPTIGATGIQRTLVEFSGFAVSTVAGSRRFTKTSATGAAIPTCYVTYTPPPAANQAPTITVTPAPPATTC